MQAPCARDALCGRHAYRAPHPLAFCGARSRGGAPIELIFEVTLPPYRVSPGVFAYQYNGRYYLPLLELAESYEFFTESDMGRGFVRGWWSEALNSFSIDLERDELIIRGERFTLSPDDVLEEDNLATDDFYVSIELLSRIWPLDFDVELSSLSVVSEIRGDVTLPFEQRMRRQQRQEALFPRGEAASGKGPALCFQ